MINQILKLRNKVKEERPLIHCITNPISINDCANVVLAIGARPIMAEHPKEVCEITKTSSALSINLGNITDVRMESMMLSGKTALYHGIPQCMDIVGVGCSRLRLDFARQYMKENCPQIIKGNSSECRAICGIPSNAIGIDAGEKDEISNMDILAFKKLAAEAEVVVLVSGKSDLIVTKEQVWSVDNGTAILARITGTGCMLNVLSAAFLSQNQTADAALLAAGLMGVAGELADTGAGPGSFRSALLDMLYSVTDEVLRQRIKIVEIT